MKLYTAGQSKRTIFLAASVAFFLFLLLFFTYVTGATPSSAVAWAAVFSAICTPFVWLFVRDLK